MGSEMCIRDRAIIEDALRAKHRHPALFFGIRPAMQTFFGSLSPRKLHPRHKPREEREDTLRKTRERERRHAKTRLEVPKKSKGRPKEAKERPGEAKGRPRRGQGRPKGGEGRLKGGQGEAKGGQREAKERPREAKDGKHFHNIAHDLANTICRVGWKN